MKKLILFGLLGLGLISCEQVIDLDLPETPSQIIINGRVTDTVPVQVQVLASADYNNGSVPGISGAKVLLYENGIRVDSLLESDTLPGYYYGTFTGFVGGNYHIDVEVFDGNPLIAAGNWVSKRELLKRCPPIDSFYSEFRPEDILQDEGYYVAAHFKEPQGRGDYYRIRAWRNDSLQNMPQDLTFFEDEFSDGLNFGTPPVPALTIDGPRPVGTTYKLELGSITEAGFDYLAILQQQTVQVGSIFDPPPASIIGNIHVKGDQSDVALGFFSATKLQFAEAVIVE
ncbi:MAG: DUF4249 domain-containing protein [Flavobacteriia bacterium]|nr:DUF4249 domain-containing protein [Flavobacteriia bacterium]